MTLFVGKMYEHNAVEIKCNYLQRLNNILLLLSVERYLESNKADQFFQFYPYSISCKIVSFYNASEY